MGGGCTKGSLKTGKHSSTVAPKLSPQHVSASMTELTQRRNTVDRSNNSWRIVNKQRKSTNPFDEIEEDDELLDEVLRDNIKPPPDLLYQFLPPVYRPSKYRPCSSKIDRNSILYRSTETVCTEKLKMIQKYLISENVPHRNKRPDTHRYLQELRTAMQLRRKEKNPHSSRFFVGSFQTLLSSNRTFGQTPFSASETNLSQIKKSVTLTSKSPKRFSIGVSGPHQTGYCPSGIYNRNLIHRQNGEKEIVQKHKKLKLWTQNILKKGNAPKSRKA